MDFQLNNAPAIIPGALTIEELLDESNYLILDEMSELEAVKFKREMLERAKDFVGRDKEIVKKVKAIIRAVEIEIKKARAEYQNQKKQEKVQIRLEWDHKNYRPKQTVDNYVKVLQQDEKFKGIKYNLLAQTPEYEVDGIIKRWTDADDARARRYIELEYELSAPQKYEDAIRIIFDEKAYHPIRDIVDELEWDGKPRIETILIDHMCCEDNDYTREVSRLIFAGGINRLYNPGCKFDSVPILIGVNQGEGKSTFVRWLAIKDEFFREVSEIEGQKGIEALEGGWICEMSELLALTKSREVEAVKSYITKQSDSYRRPYDKRTTVVDRQCVFIGTTNRRQFLTDATGNRRFMPIEVHQNGYNLFANEKYIRSEILQAWAEAKVRYDKGEMQTVPKRDLINVIQRAQESAVEDDWRIDLIEDYLKSRTETCIREVWYNALHPGERIGPPERKESNEIATLLVKLKWENTQVARRLGDFGVQKVWKKLKDEVQLEFQK